MKKFIILCLASIMILSTTGCSKKNENTVSSQSSSSVASQESIAEVSSEVGLWAITDLTVDVDHMRKSYEEEGLDPDEITDEYIKESEDFLKMLIGSVYFQFNEDGTGVINFYIPEEEKTESMENEPTRFIWENGKITYTDYPDLDEDEVYEDDSFKYIFDGENILINQDGAIMKLKRIEKVEDIKNTEFWKQVKQLQASMENSFLIGGDDLEFEDDVVDEVIDEVSDDYHVHEDGTVHYIDD